MYKRMIDHGIVIIGITILAFLSVGCFSLGAVQSPVTPEPETAYDYYERGKGFFDKRDDYNAKNDFSKAIELDPNFSLAYAYRASANFYENNNRRNLDQIVADCNKAIEIDPKIIQAYYIRGQVYVYQGDYGMGYDYFGRKENFERAIFDFSQALELGGNKAVIQPKIDYALEKYTYWENVIIAEENRYDSSKFIFVSSPSSFYPTEYTNADLFDAVAASERLQVTERFAGHYISPSKRFFSDVVFVSQNGTDITFRTSDNAISKRMKVDSRTGLLSGQQVRIYYRVYRVESWQVEAIERLNN